MSSGHAAVRLLAAVCLLPGLLAGCTGRAEPPAPRAPAGAVSPATTITWALGEQPRQYNPLSASGGGPVDTAVLSGVLGAFSRSAPDGSVQPTTDFGTYRKISDDPLTVRYTIDPRAVWSDGIPVDCDDVSLAWLANSGVTGERGFAALDVARFQDMNRPRCQAGDKTFTVTYRAPVADWRSAFGPGAGWLLPAHVVERQAGLPKTFVEYAETPRSPDLARAAAFWNTGWALTPGQVRHDLLLSSGPYVIDSWEAGHALTLRPNPRWWGRPPNAGSVVVRFLGVEDQVQGVLTGGVQVIEPAADAGLAARLRADPKVRSGAVRLVTGFRRQIEHLGLNAHGVFADRAVREAFARCVPRAAIVAKIVKPVNPAAAPLRSRLVLPTAAGYAGFAPAAQPFDAVDVAGARTLLGGRAVTVRIGWRKDPDQPNQARLDTLALITASCKQAGITVVDVGSPTFLDREWRTGAYDAALMAWNGGEGVTGDADLYLTGGASNLHGYSDPQVDRLFALLARQPDPDRQTDLLRRIDALLWQDVATVPLYAYPALVAVSSDIGGISVNPSDADVAWNLAEWSRS